MDKPRSQAFPFPSIPPERWPSDEEMWRLRAYISKVGWKQFMMDISSIMAEQAHRVRQGSPQEAALSGTSVLLHSSAFLYAAEECGTFDYLADPLMPEEHKHLFQTKPSQAK